MGTWPEGLRKENVEEHSTLPPSQFDHRLARADQLRRSLSGTGAFCTLYTDLGVVKYLFKKFGAAPIAPPAVLIGREQKGEKRPLNGRKLAENIPFEFTLVGRLKFKNNLPH